MASRRCRARVTQSAWCAESRSTPLADRVTALPKDHTGVPRQAAPQLGRPLRIRLEAAERPAPEDAHVLFVGLFEARVQCDLE
ncbi:hypothetical protein FDV58_07060 [Bradyrhizobium elkanii]|uniref:Uncharacterized protein n=1 Tax=Bradyrhizobium elkanii TaxID=29448 RepID=A0A4U6S7R2_BRAEL|nr:hypothetical protein FDV58_07060 [Bradyrhizobium elkanii]